MDGRVRADASVWLPLAADTEFAVSRLASVEQELVVRIAEITPESVRIAVIAEALPASERAAREADLRAAALRALRQAGWVDQIAGRYVDR
jgi:hypothetical protein